MRIAVVAPSSRFDDWREVEARLSALAAAAHPGVEIAFHPQCGLADGHFAGSDEDRAAALIDAANDPAVDAIWFARGGYGSNRIAQRAIAAFGPAARDKAWLGYSDAGFLLAGLYRAGFANVAHGPMPRDIVRDGGEAAVERALAWLAERSGAALEPGLEAGRHHAAFNITVLGMLLGTQLEPDLADHVLRYPGQRSAVRPGPGGDRPQLVRTRRHPLSGPCRHRPRLGQQGGPVRSSLRT